MSRYSSMRDELEKISSLGVAAAEVAGLGILAKPSFSNLRNKNNTPEQKSHAKHEIAGLGVLAAHPAYEIGKAGVKAFKKFKGAGADLWDPESGHLSDLSAKQNTKLMGPKPSLAPAAPKASASSIRGKPMGHTNLGVARHSPATSAVKATATGGLGPRMSGLNKVVDHGPRTFSKSLKGWVGGVKAALTKVK